MSTREEAIEAMTEAYRQATNDYAGDDNAAMDWLSCAAALDALVPYVVMRDQMEQVGWLDEVGYLHAAPSAANHSQDTPVYIIRGGS